jgi:hypothetical protein
MKLTVLAICLNGSVHIFVFHGAFLHAFGYKMAQRVQHLVSKNLADISNKCVRETKPGSIISALQTGSYTIRQSRTSARHTIDSAVTQQYGWSGGGV